MSTFANSEDPDEKQYMLHFIRVHTVCKGKKALLNTEYMFENDNLPTISMYDGLSQIYLSNQKEEFNSIQRANYYFIVKRLHRTIIF